MTTVEIERKFLVNSLDCLKFSHYHESLLQGYLSDDPYCTVRVRTDGVYGYITIKGKTINVTRSEFEYKIPLSEAEVMLKLCKMKIEKTRHYVKIGNHSFEVDVFEGDNNGLVVAEIELKSEDEEFIKPQWLGKEVSGEDRYYNSSLATCPFSHWSEV
ncbi:CYTH domain-containing protein [Entamoeba marina]